MLKCQIHGISIASECLLSEVQGPDESNGRSCVHSPLFEEFPQLCLGGGEVV